MINILISVVQRIVQIVIMVIILGAFFIISAIFTKYIIGMNDYGWIYLTISAISLILGVWVLINESDGTNIEEYGFRPMLYFLQCILVGICAIIIVPIIISIVIVVVYFLFKILSKIFL